MKRIIGAIILSLFFLESFSQEIPLQDTFTLGNGLKVHLLQYGNDSILSLKLVINGGKKNESECQVGYSEIIQRLINATLNQDQEHFLKRTAQTNCELFDGRTTIGSKFSNNDLNTYMELLSKTLSRLCFTKFKIDSIVSKMGEYYLPENISSSQLSNIFTNFLLYGSKQPMGRTYCQYQIQKVLPETLREFYVAHYMPKGSVLTVCGKFNAKQVKRVIAKQFVRWKPLREVECCDSDEPATPKLVSKEIAFVNKTDARDYFLKWIFSAPSPRSSDRLVFTVACNLFSDLLKAKMEKNVNSDSIQANPISIVGDIVQIYRVSNQTKLTEVIRSFDTAIWNFNNAKITELQLLHAIDNLKKEYASACSTESILSFYDPFIYDFETRKNYDHDLANLTLEQIQTVIEKYFNAEYSKLIIVGKEHLVSDQLIQLKKATKYETTDFETCDESCKEVIVVKCHCESCYRRGYCNIWRFDPSEKKAIKNAKARAKFTVKQ